MGNGEWGMLRTPLIDSCTNPLVCTLRSGLSGSAYCMTTVEENTTAAPCRSCRRYDKHNALDNLQAFTSDNAQRNYGVQPPEKTVRLVKESMTIPDRYGDVVPMWAGRDLLWRVLP